MRTSTLLLASLSIAAGSIATAPLPAHGQGYGYGYGGYAPYYPSPETYTRTIYRQPPPTWQTHCPRPTSRGVGRVFDGMDCGVRYFFDY